MQLVLTTEDLSSLSDATRAELTAKLFQKRRAVAIELPAGFEEDDFENVVDLTPGQIEEFMKTCAPETVAGLKVFAEHGPVIHADLLGRAGIVNYAHFQGRVTKRTRTVTGDKTAFLFGWDDWSIHDSGIGYYAITPTTLRSLRIFFELD